MKNMRDRVNKLVGTLLQSAGLVPSGAYHDVDVVPRDLPAPCLVKTKRGIFAATVYAPCHIPFPDGQPRVWVDYPGGMRAIEFESTVTYI